MPKNNQTSLTTLGFSTSIKRVALIAPASTCTRPESSGGMVLTPRPCNPPEISSMVPVVCTPSYLVPSACSSEVVLNPRPSNPPEICRMVPVVCTPSYLVLPECSCEVCAPFRRNKATMQSDDGSIVWLNSSPI